VKKIIVPLATGCEELEAVSITDILRGGVNVTTAFLDQNPVVASRGLSINADISIDDVDSKHYDGIVLPGGLPGANHLRDNEKVKALIQKFNQQNKLVGAICASPKVLINAGITEGLSLSAYPNSQAEFPGQAINDEAISIQGHIFTSRGPGTAMDFALALLEFLTNKENRDSVERALVR